MTIAVKEFLVVECKLCGGWCCKCLCNVSGVEHFVPLNYGDVLRINPWLPVEIDILKFQWAQCKLLDDYGLCSKYAERSIMCRTYPNVDLFLLEYLTGDASFYVPWCVYREPVLVLNGVPFEWLESGDLCQKKYLELIFEDPAVADRFHGKHYLIEQAKKTI